MHHFRLLSPQRTVFLAFVPMLLFLLFVPVVGYSDELKTLGSPREIARISGNARAAAKRLPAIAEYRITREIRLLVTAYSSTRSQTDNDPFTTASGARVADGIIAHNTLPFGTRVRFPEIFGDRVFVVQDRMNRRYGGYIADLWMPSYHAAKQWGVRRIKMQVLEPVRKS